MTVLLMLMISPVIAIDEITTPENILTETATVDDFTHTVFAEYATTTWCPSCPPASEALYTIYQSGDYSFYYVSLISDVNSIAKDRMAKYFTVAVPTVYFDGGDLNMVGNAGSVPATEAAYRALIEESGGRTVKSIELTTTATWLDNAKIEIIVTVQNTGNSIYFGKLRSYVTEIESRWVDKNGDPYHFGFLDFAINQPILLFPGSSKTFTVTWDGAADHGGQSFSDILSENIMVISTISHWIPHLRTGYETDNYKQVYLAFFVDETSGATLS